MIKVEAITQITIFFFFPEMFNSWSCWVSVLGIFPVGGPMTYSCDQVWRHCAAKAKRL